MQGNIFIGNIAPTPDGGVVLSYANIAAAVQTEPSCIAALCRIRCCEKCEES